MTDQSITINQAAELAGRSYAWAWDRAADGRFKRLATESGRVMVTRQSVLAEITKDTARRWASEGPRLVVDNTQSGQGSRRVTCPEREG